MGSTAGGAEAEKRQLVAKCKHAAESAILYESAILSVMHAFVSIFTMQ